jgi:hypothetical protein
MAVPPPLSRLLGVPASVASALRVLPQIAEHTEAMTGLLQRILSAIDGVSTDTEALPALSKNMQRVGDATAVLEPMDARMAAIEAAMPVLVEVQGHLARVPDTLERLDVAMAQLSGQLERMLGSLDTLAESVDSLQEGLGPLGRLASRWPRRSRNARPDSAD